MIGETISHYHIVGKLGGGGMGVIYEAEDTRLGRHVALKFIPESLIGDRNAVDRFEREARAASQITHPNVCTIHDIEDNDGHPFIVMEKLDGESLKERMHRKSLDFRELLDIAIQVVTALEALHARGIIHRDIKPGNIFLTLDGPVKVFDFGLAKLSRDHPLAMSDDTPAEDLTAADVVPGTAVYMSPEQARNEEIDARSDLFSLGVVLYEMAGRQKPFHGRNVVTTLDAVLHQKPKSPLAFNPTLPPALVGIIGKAMEKNRRKRYPNAAAMKADLERLDKELEAGLTKSALRSGPLRLATDTFQGSNRRLMYVLFGISALLIAMLVAVGAWWWKNRESTKASAVLNTIAVLPLQNMSHDASIDYLRFALADEIANALTYAHALEIRPSSATQKYADKNVDPRRVGRELHVGILLTGHFLRQGQSLVITLEAIEVDNNRLLWQNSVQSPAENLIIMQGQLASHVRQSLLPALGFGGSMQDTGTSPANPEAYDLYLRSIAVPHDPAPNKEAITILERVVGMDTRYAPAWEALGLRYYYDATYASGGEAMFQRSNAAYERAVSLDPNRISAAGNLITNQVERGELSRAYPAARALVQRRPESAQAHFTLAYVLRYAGLLDQATHECDAALALDAGNYQFRSCAWAFIELGRTERATTFVGLDAGSEWSAYITPSILLREGKLSETREAVKRMPDNPRYHRNLLESCVQSQSGEERHKVIGETEAVLAAEVDPEPWYNQGAILAFCGESADAVRFLRTAIRQNYCAYSALKADPLLARLRTSPDFNSLLAAANHCQSSVSSAAPGR